MFEMSFIKLVYKKKPEEMQSKTNIVLTKEMAVSYIQQITGKESSGKIWVTYKKNKNGTRAVNAFNVEGGSSLSRTFSSWTWATSTVNDFLDLLDACFAKVHESLEKQESQKLIEDCLKTVIVKIVLDTDYTSSVDVYKKISSFIDAYCSSPKEYHVLMFDTKAWFQLMKDKAYETIDGISPILGELVRMVEYIGWFNSMVERVFPSAD